MSQKPPANKNRKPEKYDDEKIADMVDARDVAGLTAALDDGLDPAWQDQAGRTLMHFAVLWDDRAAFETFAARGVPHAGRDHSGETPEHLARALGYNAIAYKLAQLPQPAGAFDYQSLADMRRLSAENLSDQFNHAVRSGGLDGLLALARQTKGADALRAADLLGRGADGDTTILTICQQGQLGKILDVEIWKDKPEEFRKLWQEVPQDYAAAHNAEAFLAQAHQAFLQSYVQPDFTLGRRRPPSGGKPPKP